MSNSSDYIITTVSSSVGEYGASAQAPFRLGPLGSIGLRLACRPYFVSTSTIVFTREDCE